MKILIYGKFLEGMQNCDSNCNDDECGNDCYDCGCDTQGGGCPGFHGYDDCTMGA